MDLEASRNAPDIYTEELVWIAGSLDRRILDPCCSTGNGRDVWIHDMTF
jgi:hypothetical protein